MQKITIKIKIKTTKLKSDRPDSNFPPRADPAWARSVVVPGGDLSGFTLLLLYALKSSSFLILYDFLIGDPNIILFIFGC
jgi:hypothetical protein